MKKKVTTSFLLLALVFICIGINNKVESSSENHEIFNMMEEAKKDSRPLTSEESKIINEFYLYKPLKERGDELDYSLNMMFNTFGTESYEEYKERAEKELK